VKLDLALYGPVWPQILGALGAILVALNLDVKSFEPGFKKLRAIKGRGSVHTIRVGDKIITLMDESYNANPASMKAALEAFETQTFGGGKKVVVLGDMAELGDLAPIYHMDLQPLLRKQGFEKVFACGPLMEALFNDLPTHQQGAWAPTAMALLDSLKATLEHGDAVLVKGSNSMGLGALGEALQHQSL